MLLLGKLKRPDMYIIFIDGLYMFRRPAIDISSRRQCFLAENNIREIRVKERVEEDARENHVLMITEQTQRLKITRQGSVKGGEF